MEKIKISSKEYWENLSYDFKGLFKIYPVQVFFSLLVSLAITALLFVEGQIFFALFLGISYFFATNILLLVVSDKIENGFAQNTVTAHILFGTSTDRLKLSYFYWFLKFIVIMFKVLVSPFLLAIGLLQYQSLLNKIKALHELEN